jgi:hypothetical protein
MSASVTITEFMTDEHYAALNVARAAARRGDHVAALGFLARAHAYARAMQHYFEIRNAGRTKAERWQRTGKACHEQMILAGAFISACLDLGYVSAIHLVDGILCEPSGEYRRVTNDNASELEHSATTG